MKLASKKFFHNLLAVVVSVCMICTLTPAMAWASDPSDDPFYNPDYSSGASSSDSDGVFLADSSTSTTATGSTEVKATLYDSRFAFKDITRGDNFTSESELREYLGKNPIKAVFTENALPQDFTVSWYIQERVYNDSYDKDQPESDSNPRTLLAVGPEGYTPLAENTYTNTSSQPVNNVFTFPTNEDSPQADIDALMSNVELGNMYELLVVLKDNGSDKEASATTRFTLFPDYPNLTLDSKGLVGKGAGSVNNITDYAINGNIYVAFDFFQMTFPKLGKSDIDPTVQGLIQTKASNNGQEVTFMQKLWIAEILETFDQRGPYLSGDGSGLDVYMPLPEDYDAGEATSVTVYGYNEIGKISDVREYGGSIETIGDKQFVKFTVENTGIELGSFAIGSPMQGSYTIHTSSSDGGFISPNGNEAGDIVDWPLSQGIDFTALAATTGYAFDYFTVGVGSPSSDKHTGSDVSGNLFKFNPLSFGVKNGNDVYVHAEFKEVDRPSIGEDGQPTEPATTYSVRGTLTSSDGATGSMTISTAESYDGAPDPKTINVGQANVLVGDVNDYAGLFIEFNPDRGSTIDYVLMNGETLSFDYANGSVMVGALTGNTTIQVGYKRGTTPEPSGDTKIVTGYLDTAQWPMGFTRAYLMDGPNQPIVGKYSKEYTTPVGTVATIDTYHTTNYRIDSAWLITKNTITADKGVVYVDGIRLYDIAHGEATGPDKGVVNITKGVQTGENYDTVNLYNVSEDAQVVMLYVPKGAEVTGSWGEGGRGDVVTDDKAKGNSDKNSIASKIRSGNTQDIVGTTLEEGDRARIYAQPNPGYELARVLVNGTNVTDSFELHDDVLGDYFTLTVLRTETGNTTREDGIWNLRESFESDTFLPFQDNVVDTVVPIESTIASIEVTFDQKVPTSPNYLNVNTHVIGNGGTITPSFKVEPNTSSKVYFFPNETFKVKRYFITDSGEVPTESSDWKTPSGNGPESLECTVDVTNYNVDVYVEFEAGNVSNMPDVYTVTPLAYAGGTISPAEPVKVYKGKEVTFSVIPKTGYEIKRDADNNPLIKLEGDGVKLNSLQISGYTCTVRDIESDCTLTAQFKSIDANVAPTHTVIPNWESEIVEDGITKTSSNPSEGGTVNPSSPFTVANGADASFTIQPNPNWYIKGIYAIGAGSESTGAEGDANTDPSGKKQRGINLVGSLDKANGRSFVLRDVQEDTQLDVVFARLSDLSEEDRAKKEPPTLNDDAWFTIAPAELGEGSTMSPDLSDMKFIYAKDSGGGNAGYATDDLDFTIIVADGYSLDESALNGGITIMDGDEDITEKAASGGEKYVQITNLGNGLYEVTIRNVKVTPNTKIIVNTTKDKASQAVVKEAAVNISYTDGGFISPNGGTSDDGALRVEYGTSQTFSFIPNDGYKLFRVYLDDKEVNADNYRYTMHNITGGVNENGSINKEVNKLHAVFVPLEETDEVPAIDKKTVTVAFGNQSDRNRIGALYPEGGVQVVAGSALSIFAKPLQPGYKAVAYEGNKNSGTEIPIVGNTIELTNIQKDMTVTVYFEPIDTADLLNLIVTYGEDSIDKSDAMWKGGIATPSGNTLIAKNQTQTISILPDEGNAVKWVEIIQGDGGTNIVQSSTMASAGDGTLKATTDSKGITFTTPPITKKTQVHVVFCGDGDNTRDKDLPTGKDLGQPNNNTYYDVTGVVQGGGGTVLPNYARVAYDASLTFTIIPLEGYHLTGAWLNDVPVSLSDSRFADNNTTFKLSEVRAGAEFKVAFDKDDDTSGLDDYYTIFASVAGNGGTVSPAGPVVVAGGGSQSFTILPDPNFKVKSISISNIDSGSTPTTINSFTGSSYTLFNVSSNLNFIVTFAPVDTANGETPPPTILTHTIKASASLNGSISPSGERKVDHGGDAMFSFIPWDGYKLSYIIVDGLNIPASHISNMQYTFPKVTEDHTIRAVYIEENKSAFDYVTVNATAYRNGTVVPNGAILVDRKVGSVELDVTPFFRYKVSEITINDDVVGGANYDYTRSISGPNFEWVSGTLLLKNLDSDTDVQVKFARDTDNYPNKDDSDAPDYGRLGSSSSPAGSGSTSVQPDPVYFEEPDKDNPDPNDPNPGHTDVTIIPEDGKEPDKVDVGYGDGSHTVVTEDGTYEFGPDGKLKDSNGNTINPPNGYTYDQFQDDFNNGRKPSAGPTSEEPNLDQVIEDGKITVDTDRGDIDVDIHYKDNPDFHPNKDNYVDVNITYTGGGMVGPSGTVTVSKKSNLTVFMIPNPNYEIASVTVDGDNMTKYVTKYHSYVLEQPQHNTDIHVVFGYAKSENDDGTGGGTYDSSPKFTAKVVSGNGSVSPNEAVVPAGGNQVVYFFPDEGWKIGSVKVTRSSGETQEYDSYNSPTMAIRSIYENVNVEVSYVETAPGEDSWHVDSVRLKVQVGSGNGKVSPEEALVPPGSSVDVNFFPDEEWTAAYYTLNGKTYTIPQNVNSWTVTPDPSKTGDGDNVMNVFFERENSGPEQAVHIKVVGGNGTTSEGIDSYKTVAFGGSTSVYVYPNVGNGKAYTIDTAQFIGVEQIKVPVAYVGTSNKESFTVSGGTYRPSGSASKVTDNDIKQWFPNGVATHAPSGVYFDAYRIDLTDIVTSGTLEIKFKEIPNGTSGTMVTTDRHTMTISSYGGGMVSPVGSVVLPVGEYQEILTTTFSSYYLASIIRTDRGSKTQVDYTDKVQGRTVKVQMGNEDCDVVVTFKRIGEPADPVYVSLISATYNGNSIPVEVGGYYDPDTGKIKPLMLNEQGVFCDDQMVPIQFSRGGTYDFYFSPKVLGDNGRELVLSNAKFNGNDLPLISGANYLTNVTVNASGGFELEFRELNEGETQLYPDAVFTVTVEATGPGTAEPSGMWTVQLGESFQIDMRGNTSNDAVKRVTLIYENPFTGEPVEETVDPSEYASGTYKLVGINHDYTIKVEFDTYKIVEVDWENDKGFITPNHVDGDYLYMPIGMPQMDFIFAPYADYKLENFYVGTNSSNASAFTFSDDPQFADDLQSQLNQLQTAKQNAARGIMTMAAAVDPGIAVEPTGDIDYSSVYGSTVPLENTSTYVNPVFVTTQDTQKFTITASVRGGESGHGTISVNGSEPFVSSTIEVEQGGTRNFIGYPDSGYAVTAVLVDGQSVGSNPYSFRNVDANHTIEFVFGLPTPGDGSGSGSGSGGESAADRFIRVASSLAQTGDLTGPVVGLLLLIAAAGLTVTAVSYMRRQRRRRARMAARR